ncbi:succinate-semialdehyde dehydrogenase (NADP(+)) [Roseovarius sp. HI0049]|nr:succinate-semialdehyde dehydrogenase (NADP(+)) [Roseovarius sp. HI0049]
MRLTNPHLLRAQCLVDGQWCGTTKDAVVDPAASEPCGYVPRFGRPETERAIDAAQAAFAPWSKRLAEDRADLLMTWFLEIKENAEDLATILTSEQGKPIAEARGEIDYAASFIRFYAEEARRVFGVNIPSHRRDGRIQVWKEPIGVAAAITPWNFPAAMITRKVAPALAAGCTMIVKPAPETPLTALALGYLATEAGLPAGVLNIVTGDAREIGSVLTRSESVRALSFTGSTRTGKLLLEQCASTVKRTGMELGGNAPFIVFDDADIDTAVEGAIVSKFRNSGQTCVCANRFLVHDSLHDEFAEKLADRAARLVCGNGFDPEVTQGPLIGETAVEKVEAHIEDAVARGALIVTGGKRHALGGSFFEPTVLTNVDPSMLVAQEEVFGPVAPILRFRELDEALKLANSTPYGLAAYFYSRDIGRIYKVAETLEFGMVGVNTGAISTEVVPFGGVKESGLGREGGQHGIEEYLEQKYVLLASVGEA